MSFASDSGYTPDSIEVIMSAIKDGINSEFGTTYTDESFLGTNFYKYFYALAQKVELNEVKTSEIFSYLTQYFAITNEMIERPVATPQGLVDFFTTNNFVASVKPMIDADAGKISVCVDTDNSAPAYATTKLAINTIIKDCVAAGVVSQGTEVNSIVLTNGQSFDFKFALPNYLTALLRLTLTLSVNNQVVIDSPETVKGKLLANIAARYRLGKNFEPMRYFTQADAPWTSTVLLEWSTDAGSTYHSTVFSANFNDLYEVSLANITLVEV